MYYMHTFISKLNIITLILTSKSKNLVNYFISVYALSHKFYYRYFTVKNIILHRVYTGLTSCRNSQKLFTPDTNKSTVANLSFVSEVAQVLEVHQK